jgi:nitrate/TMAO reductase-like tetraheme cytochrome c subunit
MTLLRILFAVAFVLLLPLLLRPSLTLRRAGRVFAFVAIALVPALVALAGLTAHVERSKTVEFCTSCHVMKRYGRSLHIDDLDHLAAKHFQYARVPRETACFSCHTTYTMYGDFTAKLRGLRHVWVQYAGTIPKKIALYEQYNNRECLHCHDGARSFVDAVTHKSEPGRLDAIRANRLSCVSSGCHGIVHDVAHVDALPSWPSKEEK